MCLKKLISGTGIILALLGSFLIGNSQPKLKIDSLKKVLINEKGVKRIKPLIKLGQELADSIPVNAISFLDEAYRLSVEYGDSAGIVKAGWIQGELWRRQEQLDTALNRLQFILPIAERNGFRKDNKRILNSLAVISTYKAKYDLALEYNFKSLNLREQDGDQAGMSISYNNLGLNYFKLSNYDLSLKFYQKALSLKKTIGDTYDLDRLLINMGLCYNKIGKYKMARDFFYEGLAICDKDCNPFVNIEAQYGLGTSYYGLNDLKNAKEHFENSLNEAIKMADKKNQIENLVILSKVLVDLDDLKKSKHYLQQALSLVEKTSYKGLLLSIYNQAAILADKEKDFERASNNRKYYIQLRDSIYNDNIIKNLANIQTNFFEKENLATIEANKVVISNNRSLALASIFIAILLAVILYLLQSQRIKMASVNGKLQVKIQEATEDLFNSHEKLLRALDDRDYFMYKSSHDLRGPLATFIGLIYIAKLDIKDPQAIEYFDRMENTALKLNKVLTRILSIEKINQKETEYNFVDFYSIIEAILVLEKPNITAQKIIVTYEVEPNIIVKSDSEIIQTILENFVSNSVKFCDNSFRKEPFAHIKVFKEIDKLIIQVIDNGIGISEEMIPKMFKLFIRASERSETGGIGLYMTKLAAEKLEGVVSLRIENGLTIFEAKLPADIGPILRAQREFKKRLDDRRKKSNLDIERPVNLVFV